ncbi:hypothetical protein K505DRAFT_126262 [Melanomma pulvis-pyrius CBS 109.77]|uniref:CorA-like transporter domain-containing protein n=1 Tax=Melanomma pulvis-pyrius CBS 109.77 TaxID=1314802 RepID=A0A6A6XN40_9PLEO|nr:hypothetical protein K505DRAFT_126262 [Melanomma pulvis-pyrius CBS 109.77]
METSRYFERTLFYDRSPAADEYYERSADLIFEKDPGQSTIEVRVQSSIDVSFYKQKDEAEPKDRDRDNKSESPPKSLHSMSPRKLSIPKVKIEYTETREDAGLVSDDEEDSWSLSSKASSTALPTALDQRRGGDPPTYPGLPKLAVVDLDLGKLSGFIRHTNENFRVFYLRQRHSHSRIKVTKEIFEQLLRSCHVFPRFNEYIIGFGLKNSESEIGPPPLKFRPLCNSNSNSYQGFECSYILRYVEFTNRSGGKDPWSLRQFAIYHRFKPKSDHRCSTWILVGASQRTEVRLDHYTRSIDDLTGTNPFELHVIFLDTAIASWRPYLVDLTQKVTHQSNKAVGITIGSDDGDDFITIELEDHQELKQIEDKIADLILCLDSTSDTVSTFMDMYDQFRDNRDDEPSLKTSSHKSAYGSDAVVFALKEKFKEIAYTRRKAEALLSKVQNTRTLISSLLERQSGHNINQQISALHSLEQQGQVENTIMREIAEKNSRDSSSMRVLTIITMIYLPCTIVSNFYSTQFVKQNDLLSGGTQLEYTQNSWLFFAISVPLTVLTILVWYLWVNSKRLLQLVLCRVSDRDERLSSRTWIFRLRRSFRGLPR